MKKTALLILFILFCSTNIFALEKDTLYKYAKLDLCLSAGSTETYDKEGDEIALSIEISDKNDVINWSSVFSRIKSRGVRDILIICNVCGETLKNINDNLEKLKKAND